MSWQFNNKEPVFIQIASKLLWDIVNGAYSPDEQIPSVRQLAMQASVNPNTMQKALSRLEEQGILCSHGTVGRFVTSDTQALAFAREEMRRQAVRDILEQARAIDVSAEELITYIKEEYEK